MSLRTYSGSCHCGQIRFTAAIDLAEGTVKCNCSSCTKARSWLAFIPAGRFTVIAGFECQETYQWTPPGRTQPSIRFHFCKTCGIRMPAWGDLEAMGGAVYAVQVALLDDVMPDELAAAPIRYLDGRNDHFERAPADTRLL